jgi:hypothetical protein
MRTPRHVIVASAVGAIALGACQTPVLAPGALPWPTDPGSSGLETAQAAVVDGGFLYEENARWPQEIPADIPPLEGEIRVVTVIQGIQYRIEYSSVSKQTLSQYLADLEALGFELQYIVYTAPSIPDEETAGRIVRGEWDAVGITKELYHMHLEVGEGQATYDIDNADFMTPGPEPQITPTPLVWPSDMPDRVPQPAS